MRLNSLCTSVAILFSFLLIMVACNEPTSIGGDVIDDEDLVNTLHTDTFQIEASTMRSDPSLITSILSRPYYLLGSLNDPEFGSTHTGIYTQMRLLDTSIDLGDPESLTLDSVVLSLDYVSTEVYGDQESPINLKVYELEESIFRDSTYYSNNSFALGEEIGSYSGRFKPADSVSLAAGDSSILVEPHLRIKLSDVFGDRLLAQSGGTNFENNTNFTNFFKGMYITPDTTATDANSIAYFNLLSSLSTVTLFYRTAVGDTSFRFYINSNVAAINSIAHNYQGATAGALIDSPVPNGQEVMGLQGLSGLDAHIKIPGLADLGPVVINKAVLQVTAFDESETYPGPSALTFKIRNSEGENIYTEDHSNINARIDTTTSGGTAVNVYEVPVSYYAENYVLGNYREETFVLTCDYYNFQSAIVLEGLIPNRQFIAGPEHPEFPMKLIVTYTDAD